MKKLFYSAVVMALAFFAGSCQQENLEPVQSGSNTVTYTVQVPGAGATKASNAVYEGVTELVYEVYRQEDVDDLTKEPVYEDVVRLEDGKTTWTLDLEFVKDQYFTVLFWAQNPGGGIYNTVDLRKVSLNNPSDLDANADTYAAFAGADLVYDCVSELDGNVILVRPIAQINIATSSEGLAVGTTPIDITHSEVVVTGLSAVYNVADGTVSGAHELAYSKASVPDADLDANHTYVAKNYVGFAPMVGDNAEVSFKIYTSEGEIDHVVSNVPVKPNYRTNIVGNLITANEDYNIELDTEWDPQSPIVVEVMTANSASDLVEAIEAAPADGSATNIRLEVEADEDGNKVIDLSALTALAYTKASVPTHGVLIPAGKSIVLDLNGCTIRQVLECSDSYSMIKNEGNLTITGEGSIEFTDASAGASSAWGTYTIENRNGVLTLQSGTIKHCGSLGFAEGGLRPTDIPIQNYQGKVIVNGGVISSPQFRSLRDFTAGGEIIINGGKFEGQVWMQGLGNGSSSLTINGGEFAPTEGYDGSSVYVTNDTNDIIVKINGGNFTTKIGSTDKTKPGISGCVTGGIFAADPSAYVANGYAAEQNEEGKWIIVAAPEIVNGVYVISNLAQFEYFAKSVNAGNKYSRETVELAADIDLNGKEWTPIGTSANPFNGTFDGKNHTISNLVVNGGTGSEKGLFGRTNDGVIKNLTVNNAKVSGRLYVAVVAGTPYTSNYENIKVTGHVEVNGMAYVGAVAGYNAYGNYTDITVKVDEGSYVYANSVENGKAYRTYVGGVVGFIGEGEHTYTNISSNINVKGSTVDIGGLFGIAHYGNKFQNCVCTGNVEITNASEAEDCTEVGGIAGVWHNETGYTVSFTNCSFTGKLISNIEGVELKGQEIVGAAYNTTGTGKLIIDGAYSVKTAEELTAAITAGGKYILLNDITIAEKWDNRYKGKATNEISINGNGKTVKFTGMINDGYNYHSAFRFVNTAEVKNLTIDLSEASAPGKWIRAISSSHNLTVDACTFIGPNNDEITKDNAIVFGDSNESSQLPYEVSITGCKFNNWSRGVSDNENAKEVKKFVINDNVFVNAEVNVSAYESITFCNNVTDSAVRLISYTNGVNTVVSAYNNTLNASKVNQISNFSRANVQAQKEFSVYYLD